MKYGVKFTIILAIAALIGWGCPFASLWVGVGVAGGLALGEWSVKRLGSRRLGLLLVGLLVGYIATQTLLLLLDAVVNLVPISVPPAIFQLVRRVTFLTSLYWGCAATLALGSKGHLELPFVSLKRNPSGVRGIWLDASALADPRLLDLAATGLLNRRCVLWRGVMAELQGQIESVDELTHARARRSLDVIKRLLELERLHLRVDDTEMPPGADARSRLAQLVRQLDGDILTGDLSQLESAAFESVAFVNLHALSSALKPLTNAGEFLELKILRQGKEPSQGVGYLQDGTMVVVNGAGEWIGKEVRTRVLSVKHSSAGRIVFCNLLENETSEPERRPREATHRY